MTVIESFFYVPMNIFQPNFVEMSVYLYKAPWKFQNTEFHSKQKKHNNDRWRGGSLHISWSGIQIYFNLLGPLLATRGGLMFHTNKILQDASN